MANKDIVLKSSSKPLKPGDILSQSEIDSKEVLKIIKDLRKEGKVYSPKRCYYALKE